MTTGEFETIAKNALIKLIKEKHHVDVKFENLQFAWFAHELGYKKCTLYAPELGHWYPEITYNAAKNELYVDIYLKQSNTRIAAEDFCSMVPVTE